jgi:hypothetical protein
MTNPQNAFFFEIEEIPENSPIFEELQKEELFFSYFQVDQKYYLFFYGQKPIDINLIKLHLQIIEELDRKQRKIRSLRGFFFYALEIMKNGKDFEILRTNLQVSFWRKLKTILRQNKKEVLLQFLFGRVYSYQGSTPHSDIIEMIQNLQNQVNSLQDRIRDLETTLENSKYALSRTLKASEATKIIQQDDSTLKDKNGSSLTQNDSTINHQVREVGEMNLEMLSEDKISPLEPLSDSQQYNPQMNIRALISQISLLWGRF